MSTPSPLVVTFRSHHRKASSPPNPDYPKGIDIDVSGGKTPTCSVEIPYPAEECGVWMVQCLSCGYTLAITAAGRPDDPRSATVPCQLNSSEGPQ